MKSFSGIKNSLCTSIENLILKLLSKFQSDPCNHVEVISSPRFKKVVWRKTRSKFVWSLKLSLKFKVIDRAQPVLRGAAGKSLAEPFKKKFLTIKPGAYCFYGIKTLLEGKKIDFFGISRVALPLNDGKIFGYFFKGEEVKKIHKICFIDLLRRWKKVTIVFVENNYYFCSWFAKNVHLNPHNIFLMNE